jgi:hypothetical protein
VAHKAEVTTENQTDAQRVRLREIWQAWSLAVQVPEKWPIAAVICRTDLDVSLRDNSVEAQLAGCLAELTRRKLFAPWELVFVETGPAGPLEHRPALRRLLEEAQRAHATSVVVIHSTRLFRSQVDAQVIQRELLSRGIEIVWPDMPTLDPLAVGTWRTAEAYADCEFRSRQISYCVGKALESRSRSGMPVGPLPEVYRVKARGPRHNGRRGQPIEWGLVEPLASIVSEGGRRRRGGATYGAIASWSSLTALMGITPAGRKMEAAWWQRILSNPKLAGRQWPYVYDGYRPGRVIPRLGRPTDFADTVDCKLPSVFTWEEFLAMGRRARVTRTDRSRLRSGRGTGSGR